MNDVNLKQRYQPVINKLSQIYEAHEVINEFNDNPIEALTEYIETLPLLSQAIEGEPPNIDMAVRAFIKKLNCFRWRFVNENNAGDVWNPLFEPYSEFKARSKGKIKNWYDDNPFPSEEIIENWIKSYVPQNSQHSKKITKRHPR